MSTHDDPAAIERKLPEGCRYSLAHTDDGCVCAERGEGRTISALERRGLIEPGEPFGSYRFHWARRLTPLGRRVAILARASERPGGGAHRMARR